MSPNAPEEDRVEVPATLAAADARWHPHAACARDGPDPYFTRRPTGRSCAACPAAEPCLWAAMALEQIVGYRYGIWGGTTPARRDRIAGSLPDLNYGPVYLAVVDAWRPPAPAVQSGMAA